MIDAERGAPFGTREIPADRWFGVYAGLVQSVDDPERLGRVRVHLPFASDQGGPSPTAKDTSIQLWARIAVPLAGTGSGLWIRPNPGDEVLVAFAGGDPAAPYVLGCLWNQPASPPSGVDHSADNRTTVLRTRGGSTIYIDDTESTGQIEIRTPGGVSLRLDDGPQARATLSTPEGRKLEIDDGGNMVTLSDPAGSAVVMTSSGIELNTAARVKISGSTLDVTAAKVTVNAGTADFSGVVKCDTMIANSVVASSYTPGAGNIW